MKTEHQEMIGKIIGVVLVVPLIFVAYLTYKLVIKGGIAWVMMKLGLDPAYAGIAGFVIGALVIAAIAKLGAPLWAKIDAWVDEDDPDSGSNRMLAEYEEKKRNKAGREI